MCHHPCHQLLLCWTSGGGRRYREWVTIDELGLVGVGDDSWIKSNKLNCGEWMVAWHGRHGVVKFCLMMVYCCRRTTFNSIQHKSTPFPTTSIYVG